MENGKSIFLQARPNKKNLTLIDMLMITLNNYELNLINNKKKKEYQRNNANVQGIKTSFK
jgi:hypothetical protein